MNFYWQKRCRRYVTLGGWVCGEGYIKITWEMVSNLIHWKKSPRLVVLKVWSWISSISITWSDMLYGIFGIVSDFFYTPTPSSLRIIVLDCWGTEFLCGEELWKSICSNFRTCLCVFCVWLKFSLWNFCIFFSISLWWKLPNFNSHKNKLDHIS